jgi:hypothetical protein
MTDWKTRQLDDTEPIPTNGVTLEAGEYTFTATARLRTMPILTPTGVYMMQWWERENLEWELNTAKPSDDK